MVVQVNIQAVRDSKSESGLKPYRPVLASRGSRFYGGIPEDGGDDVSVDIQVEGLLGVLGVYERISGLVIKQAKVLVLY